MYTPTAGRPKWRKKTYVIRFTNFLITAYIMVGSKDARRRTLFCDIPFMKEQVSNQEKGTFYLYSKQGGLWPCVPLVSAALHGGMSTSVSGMKVSYIKLLPCITLGNRWRLIKSPVLEATGFWWRQRKWKLISPFHFFCQVDLLKKVSVCSLRNARVCSFCIEICLKMFIWTIKFR